MSTLLLRLAGPMQSWGTQSRFGNRDTGLEPSKSGVIGLLCCALGWQREIESFEFDTGTLALEQFARGLVMAVRIDREGLVRRDFHTAQKVLKSNQSGLADTVLSQRYYLADAEFIVGLENPSTALLEQLERALRRPAWPLCLGRKAFVPSRLIPVKISSDDLLPALVAVPRIPRPSERWGTKPPRLRVMEETPEGSEPPGEEVRQDVPIAFSSQRRKFATRRVRTFFLPDRDRDLPMPPVASEDA